MKLTPEQITENEKKIWTRSAPADLYYNRDSTNPIVMHSTERYVTNSFFSYFYLKMSLFLVAYQFG